MSNFTISPSPHVHGGDSIEKNMYGVLIALVPTFIFSIVFYRYVDTNIQPVDTSQTQTFEVEIPSGSSVREIADILQTNKIL